MTNATKERSRSRITTARFELLGRVGVFEICKPRGTWDALTDYARWVFKIRFPSLLIGEIELIIAARLRRAPS